MTIKFVSKYAPSDRRTLRLDPTTITSINILPGQVLKENGSQFAVKADGAAVVGSPVWAFTASSRPDVQSAKAVTVVDGPFVADVDTAGYVGSPTLDAALKISTGADVGKLAVESPVDTVAKLQGVVAYCSRTADADGFIRMKAIR